MKRSSTVVGVSLALTLLLGLGIPQVFGGTYGQRPTTTVLPTTKPVVGVSSHLAWEIASVDSEMARLQAVHIKWIREDITWDAVQPVSKALYNWTTYDLLFTSAAKYGVNVVGIIAYSAPWANGNQLVTYPPINNQDYVDYAAAVVTRYGPTGSFWIGKIQTSKLTVVSVWNEPWSAQFWKPNPDPLKYADLAHRSADAVHAVSNGITVIATADYLRQNADGSQPQWFSSLLAADSSLRTHVNAWEVHAYPGPQNLSPDDNADPSHSYRRVTLTRQQEATLPIWITEVGWGTAAQCPTNVSEAQQDAYLARAHEIAETEWSYVTGFFPYVYAKDGSNPADCWGSYGLRRADNSLKPALTNALATAALEG